MFWVFSISAIIIAIFTSFKFQEEKTGRKNRLTIFLTNQDWRVEKAIIGLVRLWKILRSFLRFIFFVRIPFLLHIVLKKLSYKIADQYKRLKDYFRGKYSAYQKKERSNSYLNEISKVKDEIRNGREDNKE